jgi:hypothetical protein
LRASTCCALTLWLIASKKWRRNFQWTGATTNAELEECLFGSHWNWRDLFMSLWTQVHFIYKYALCVFVIYDD